MNMRSLEAVGASNRLGIRSNGGCWVLREKTDEKLSKLSKNCSSPNRGGTVHIVERAGRSTIFAKSSWLARKSPISP